MIKSQVQELANGAGYVVSRVNVETGKVSDSETFTLIPGMEQKELGKQMTNLVKGTTNQRRMWLQFLAVVLAHPKLEGFKATGDRTTGKISAELKAAIRDAETNTIEALIEEKHIVLPKSDNAAMAFQEYVKTIRDDKNYSNAKSYATKYFAFCGKTPATSAGMLVPQPIMVAQVAAVMERPTVDNSIHSKLNNINEVMAKGVLASDDAIQSLAEAKRLVATLEGIVKHYAEMATTARGNVSVDQVAKDTLNAMKAGHGQAAPAAARTRVPATV